MSLNVRKQKNEDSNQPVHACSPDQSYFKHCILDNPKCAQWRIWSDCANAQADLNLRWAHMSEVSYSGFVADFYMQDTFFFLLLFFFTVFYFIFYLFIFCNFYKDDNLCDFLFAFLRTKSLIKGVNSKRKEFAPTGSKFFPFRVDRLSEGRQQFWQLPPLNVSFDVIYLYNVISILTE